jgi:VWFA-related protein
MRVPRTPTAITSALAIGLPVLLATTLLLAQAPAPNRPPTSAPNQAPAPNQMPQTQAPAGPQTTFRATSNYVSTSLIVRDKTGQFIPDLRQDELKVSEDGVPQKVSIFLRVVGGRVFNDNSTAVASAATPARSEGLILPPTRKTNDTSGRIFVIFLDDLHIAPQDTPKAKDALKLIRDNLVHENDLVGFVSTGTSSVAIDPTYDFGHRRFNEAIDKIMGSAPTPNEIISGAALEGADGPTQLRHNTHVAFSTVYDMLDELSKITDRRKSFIYLSSGYTWDPFTDARYKQIEKNYADMGITPPSDDGSTPPPDDPNNPRDPTKVGPYDQLADQSYRKRTEFAESDLDRELVEVVAAARRANTAFYAIDPRGLTTGTDVGMNYEVAYSDIRDYDMTRLSSLKMLSEDTGGICVCQQNDIKKGIQRIDAETSDYYMIGYTSTNPDPLKLHRIIKIEVSRSNVGEVLYRPEYFMPRPRRK